ncbi:MAG: hypothetical protein HY525_04560 [Betaproteobacteria bacterium]|nr:hypothetical protein [Betaproteobacteria bacterium]
MMLRRDDRSGLASHFAERGALLLPMLQLVERGRQTIAAVMNEAGRGVAIPLYDRLRNHAQLGSCMSENEKLLKWLCQ